jgi:hypothetical protein
MRAIFHCERRDQTLRITREGAPGKWNVLIRGGRSAPVEVNGDEAILELS